MKDEALKRIDSLLLKRAAIIIKDDSLKVHQKKELLKELREEKQRLIETL